MDAWDGLPYKSRWSILPGFGWYDFGRDIYYFKSGLGHFMSLFSETQYGPIGPYRLNPLTGEIHQPKQDMDLKLSVLSMGIPAARAEQATIDLVAPAVKELEATGAKAAAASVDELLTMMNFRVDTRAEYASGDMLRYLETGQASGSHMMMDDGMSVITLRKDVATRWDALHEWLHRYLQRKNGQPMPGEDKKIEDFLERHKDFLRIEKPSEP